jgi:polyisoprenyl-teichoic acid--peptidoglycan teichoic acid transferase
MSNSAKPSRRRRWLRWAAPIAAVVVLLAAGALVANALQVRYAIPEDDLFGDACEPNQSRCGDGATPSPSVSPTPEPGADITGPLNILLAGIDPRASDPTWVPNADAVLILHIPASLSRAYLFSLPRDLLVDVPAYEPTGYPGGRTKLTHAMSNGARLPGQLPDTALGFALLAETVSDYTGIERFDAGAVLNFAGFTELVDAVGGVDLYVDQRVVSEHREPDGTHRTLQPGGGGYIGPQKVYEVGEQRLSGWEALDYARQRYIEGSDYARQRHQQQLIRALVARLFGQDLVTNPTRLDRVLRALGDALTFDGRGHRVIDFAFALRRVTAERITLVGLPGGSVFGSGGGYLGEELQPVAEDFLAAVRGNRVGPFLADHPELRQGGR